MSDDKTICVICAWRKDCKKKFSMDGATTTRCPDYTKDLTLKDEDSEYGDGPGPGRSSERES